MGHQPCPVFAVDRRLHYVYCSESIKQVGEEQTAKEHKTNFATNKIHKKKERKKERKKQERIIRSGLED
jgi:hypothetical protein